MSFVPHLGVGLGLRPRYTAEILAGAADDLDFFEALSENYMVPGGKPRRVLTQVRERVPLVLHGVSLNIGSVDPLDAGYLRELAALAERSEPAWISDHLCWTGVGGHNAHDLLPLPYTDEALRHVVSRIAQVQEALGQRIAIENVSSYLAYTQDAFAECEFLAAVAQQADCGILLDVNNVFVSACNHAFDPRAYLAAIPPERVFQIHLAGHSQNGPLLIDTHDAPICEEVWELYADAIHHVGPVSTLIERDDSFPPLAELLEEAARARAILEECHASARGSAATPVATDLRT